MSSKLAANADHYPTEELKMAYLVIHMEGTASLHFAPRLRNNAPNLFRIAKKIVKTLKRIFGDPNRRQTAINNYRRLYQKNDLFYTFWVEF